LRRILFLYDQLNGYTLACLDELCRRGKVEVTVVANPNTLAPFVIRSDRYAITFRDSTDFFAVSRLATALAPDAVFISGWAFKDYLFAGAQRRAAGARVVCMADSKWENRLRQHLLTPVASPFLRMIFSDYWGAGLYQYEMARRLHFPQHRIRLGLYSCDHARFLAAYTSARVHKLLSYPHRFLYVGRFSEEKGVRLLYDTYRDLLASGAANGWVLTMVGGGPLSDYLAPISGIEVRPFVQPEDVPLLVAEAGCFVMPSLREQWGVAVHEFATAGLPIICSSAVGATTAYVREGFNGFEFAAARPEALRRAFEAVVRTEDGRLRQMGDRSNALSYQFTTETWANTAMGFLGRDA
jgi:glycosyltransferase involved in cell wall biosynthesis